MGKTNELKPCQCGSDVELLRKTHIERENNNYEDCCAFYGCIAEDWDDETLKKKAALIPWEDVIAVRVSAT